MKNTFVIFDYKQHQIDYIITYPIMSKNHTATPVRLKELKAPLQEEAMRQDRSLNGLIFKILKDYLSTLKTKK